MKDGMLHEDVGYSYNFKTGVNVLKNDEKIENRRGSDT